MIGDQRAAQQGVKTVPDAEPPLRENPPADDEADLAVLRKLDRELDAELEQTFPASDPLSLTRGPRPNTE